MTESNRRVAVVTGASAGIGAATARRLAAAGYAVFLTARRAERLDALVEELRGAGHEADRLVGDIREDGVCHAIIDRAAAWGRLEVVVANAGVGYTGPFAEMTDDQMRQLVDVNLMGVLRIVRHAIPRLEEEARLVVVGSVLSRIATPHNAVYCATKHALAGFCDSLRLELRRARVRVIHVMPGYTDTEFFDAQLRRERRAIDAVKKFWFFHGPDAVASVIERRIQRPRAEVVVGGLNAAVVWLGTRFPSVLRGLVMVVDELAEKKAAAEADLVAAVERQVAETAPAAPGA